MPKFSLKRVAVSRPISAMFGRRNVPQQIP
jgi:hypothetical protein